MVRAERRLGGRVLFESSILLRLGNRRIRARGVNISATGMLVEPVARLAIGEVVQVVFPLLGEEAVLEAKVARHAEERAPTACALAFTSVPARVWARIDALLSAAPASRRDPTPPPRLAANSSPDLRALYREALLEIEEAPRRRRLRR